MLIPFHPTFQQVVEYLEHMVDILLGRNNILTDVCAFSLGTYGIEGVHVGDHRLVSGLVLGHKVHCPPIRLRVLLGISKSSWSLLRRSFMSLCVRLPCLI